MRAEKINLSEEILLEQSQNKDNFYDMETLDESVDDDMISGGEEGFMLGYMDA